MTEEMKLNPHRGVKKVLEDAKPPKEANKRGRRKSSYILEELKRLQMNIPVSLHKELKDAAYRNDVEITYIVENLVEDWLAGKKDQEWMKTKPWEK